MKKGISIQKMKSIIAFVIAFTMVVSFPSAVFAADAPEQSQATSKAVAQDLTDESSENQTNVTENDESQNSPEESEATNGSVDESVNNEITNNQDNPVNATEGKSGKAASTAAATTSVTVSYVDDAGKQITGVATKTITVGANAVDLSSYADTIAKYEYDKSTVGSNNATAVAVKYSSNRLKYKRTSSSNWTNVSGTGIKMIYTKSKSYKVNFNLNGGSGTQPASIEDVTDGTEVTMPSSAGITKSNNAFVGWSTDSTANSTKNGYSESRIYKEGEQCYFDSIDSDKTFYAIWGQENADGNFFIKLSGDEPVEPNHYSSDLYTDGIYIANALKVNKNITNDDSAITANLVKTPTDAQIVAAAKAKGVTYNPATDYVKWYVIKDESDGAKHIDGIIKKADMISLNYNPNAPINELSGDSPQGKQYKKDSSVTVESNGTLSRVGYTFEGWNTNAEGTGTDYNAGDTIELTKATTLYAKWAPKNGIHYSIKYYTKNQNGTYDLYKDVSKTGKTGATVKASPIDIPGYTFDEDNTENKVSDKVAGDGSTVLKLYYNAETYTITYYEEDGATEFAKYNNKHIGDDIDVPATTPEKAEDDTYTYEFSNWELTEGTVSAGKVGTTDLAYKAVYSKIYKNYTVTFKDAAELGGNTISEKTDYHYNDNTVTPNDPATVVKGDYTYTFKGWNKEVADKVTKNETYTATYEKTATNHKLTINYLFMGTNNVAAEQYTADVAYDTEYNVTSPAITGYTADKETVSGTMAKEDVVVNVYYTKNVHNITVQYYYEGTTTPVVGTTPYEGSLNYGDEYAIESPEVEGLTADKETVEGTMEDSDVNEVVYYAANKYDLTVKYVDVATNDEIATSHTEKVEFNKGYSVESPAVEGFELAQGEPAVVEGTMGASDKTVVVKYERNDYQLTINYYKDGTEKVLAPATIQTVAFEKDYKVESPEIEGYTLKDSDQAIITGTMPAANKTVNVYYEAGTDTKYTVAYFYEEEGKYSDTATTTDERTGTTEGNVKATEADKTPSAIYGNYIFDEAASNVLEGDIAADGSTTLKVYFKQQFSITYMNENGTSEYEKYEGKSYGDKIIQPASAPTKDRDEDNTYEFDQWDLVSGTEGENNTIASDLVYNSTFAAIPLSVYDLTINYVDEDGTQIAVPYTDSLKDGAVYEVASPTLDGYTLKDEAQSTISGQLTESKTVDVVYTANDYTITYLTDDDQEFEKYDNKHIGNRIDIPATTPEKASDGNNHYVFDTWELVEGTEGVDKTVGTTDLVYKATYASVPYSIFTLTVNYVDEKGKAVATPYVEGVKEGAEYKVESPTIKGYTLKDEAQASITGTMDDDTTVAVVYVQDEEPVNPDSIDDNNDNNNNDSKDTSNNRILKTGVNTTDSSTKTGDDSNMALWMLIALIALAGTALPMALKKKDNE